ncbi:MAG: recombinase family protein [Pseudonocardiaceae bacterium]
MRLGRPATLPPDVVKRIVTEHQKGASWSAIARGLEADCVPTAQGGARWYPATVRKVAPGQAAGAVRH